MRTTNAKTLLSLAVFILFLATDICAQTGGDWFEYAPLFDSSCPGSVIQLREGRNGALDDVFEKVGEALKASSRKKTYIVSVSLVGRFIGSSGNYGIYYLEVYSARNSTLTVGRMANRNRPLPSKRPAGH